MEDVFANAIRAAVVEKRKLRFWNVQLRKVKYPQIQAPMKPPQLQLARVIVPPSSLNNHFQFLLFNQSEGDVVFIVRGRCFRAHKICLAVSADIFKNLFAADDESRSKSRVLSHESNQFKTGMSIDVTALIENEQVPAKINPGFSMEDIEVSTRDELLRTHPAIELIEANKPCDDPYHPGESMSLTCVTLNSDITPRAFQYILEYLYTGKAKEDYECLEEAKQAAQLLQLPDLALQIINIQSNEAYLNVQLERQFLESRKSELRNIALKKELLAGMMT